MSLIRVAVILLATSALVLRAADSTEARDAIPPPAVGETHDAQGNVVERRGGDTPAKQKVFRYTYDAAGHCTSATDAAGRTSRYTRDAQGRVITIEVVNGPGEAPAKTITVTYDANGVIDNVLVDGVKQQIEGKKFEWVNNQLQVDGLPADEVY